MRTVSETVLILDIEAQWKSGRKRGIFHSGLENQTDLWNKIMAEVELGRYAGPFSDIPFEYYIQSPVGLVPKDGGKKTRLIFHLSYPKTGTTSVNANTPEELCSVAYPQFKDAIKLCISAGKGCAIAKSDLISAFRILGIRKDDWKFLVLKAKIHWTRKFTILLTNACLLVRLSVVRIFRTSLMLFHS